MHPMYGKLSIRSFVDDISVTTRSKRVFDPITRQPCIVMVHRDMAKQPALGIAELEGKVSPKTMIVGTSLQLKSLLRKELRKLNFRTKKMHAAKDFWA